MKMMEGKKNMKNASTLAEKSLKRSEMIKKYGALAVLAALFLFNLIVTDNFCSINTVWNLIVQSTVVCMLAMGMTFVISTGGIDISVGSTMAFVATISGMLMEGGMGVGLSILIGLLIGLGIGLFIGLIVVYFRVQPMVLTLALMIALRSFARLVSNAKTVQLREFSSYTALGIGKIGNVIPVQVIYMVAMILIFAFIANKTVFGKRIEAVGNNSRAAYMAGINEKRITMMAYALLGFMSAMAGIITCARTMNCNPNSVGDGMEMNAIAAVVIGGTAMEGGKPRVVGAVIGSIIIQLISITVNMNNIGTEWTKIIRAVIIIFAVYLQAEKAIKIKKTKTFKGGAALESK